MAVTPELEAVRSRLRAVRHGADTPGGDAAVPARAGGPVASRSAADPTDALHGLPDIAIETVEVVGRPACWVACEAAATDRALVYLSGGSCGAGTPDGHLRLCARLARVLRARVLLLGHAEPFESPFLARVDTAVGAARWLSGQGLGGPRTVIAGAGAGGGVAIAAVVALREEGGSLPAAVVALSPWVDLTCRGDSYRTRADVDLVWRPGELREAAALLATGTNASDPRVSPIDADLCGMPPVLVQVGTDEILLDDSVRLHERLRAAGTDGVLEAWDDMPHGFQFFEDLPESSESLARIAAFVTRQCHT